MGVNNLLNTHYSTKKIFIGSTNTDYYTPADLRSITIGGEYKF